MHAKPRGKPRPSLGRGAVYSPRLLAHVNTILKTRYCDKESVDRVREHLASMGVACHVSALQNFLRRVLTEFPCRLAEVHGVDLRLLRAVRRRLNLPVSPARRRRDTPKKTLPRFAVAGAVAAVRPRAPAKPRPKQEERRQTTAQALPARLPAPPAFSNHRAWTEDDEATGREPTIAQWQAIAEQARARLPQHLWFWHGQMLDTSTPRHTPVSTASLVADYGLSPREVKAIFLNH